MRGQALLAGYEPRALLFPCALARVYATPSERMSGFLRMLQVAISRPAAACILAHEHRKARNLSQARSDTKSSLVLLNFLLARAVVLGASPWTH